MSQNAPPVLDRDDFAIIPFPASSFPSKAFKPGPSWTQREEKNYANSEGGAKDTLANLIISKMVPKYTDIRSQGSSLPLKCPGCDGQRPLSHINPPSTTCRNGSDVSIPTAPSTSSASRGISEIAYRQSGQQSESEIERPSFGSHEEFHSIRSKQMAMHELRQSLLSKAKSRSANLQKPTPAQSTVQVPSEKQLVDASFRLAPMVSNPVFPIPLLAPMQPSLITSPPTVDTLSPKPFQWKSDVFGDNSPTLEPPDMSTKNSGA